MILRKLRKLIVGLIAAVFVMALMPSFFMAGCGTALVYAGGALRSGQVGAEYSAYVGTATGADTVEYALKEGSALPAGLGLDIDGFVTGIPEAKADAASFTVVASADGRSTEATFTLTVGEGELSYAGGAVKVANNVEFTRDLATATGSGNISYALAEDCAVIPGVTLDESGVLTGTIADMSEHILKVTASAPDCTSATAEFALSVVAPWLDYKPLALQTATVGSYFTGLIDAAADGTDAHATVSVTYRLAEGSELPAGLTLDDGLLAGTPTESGTFKFSLRASARGYTPAEAEFTLKVNRALDVEATEGKITFTASDGLTLERNTSFAEIGAVAARASNRQPVTFEVAGELPAGVKFYPNGTFTGRPTQTGDFDLTVTASAAGCPSVTAEFKVSVLVTLIYESKTFVADAANDLTVGQTCEVSLATAAYPAGSGGEGAIVYEAVSGLPAGLTLTKEGMLTGAPTKSYLSAPVVVRASAEGFASKNATFTFHVEDALVGGVTVFEAEYTDLRGIVGSGYSGSATGAGLIQSSSSVPASGSKDGKTSAVANGGSYIPFVFGPITLTFRIRSDKAVSGAALSLGLDSEIGPMALDPSILRVAVNGVPTTYSAAISTSAGAFASFSKYACGKADLIAGENIITVSIVENTIYNGRTGGPAIDCLEIGDLGGATLSWQPALYNLPKLTQA